jgi:hypothetical protein
MIEEMKRELNVVKTEIADLKAMFRRTMLAVADMKGDIADMKHVMATQMATKSDISALNQRMDGFSSLLIESRMRWAVHSDVLAEHDKRLTKLES